MTPDEAEAEIVRLCTTMDALRVCLLTPDAKEAAMRDIDEQILVLKEITGPRVVTGTLRV